MFEWIKEVLVSGWSHIVPWQVVYPTEAGVIYRLGKYNRTIQCGFNLKWPVIEKADVTDVALTTTPLEPQSLTTRDKKALVVSSLLRYEITDVKPYFITIRDSDDLLEDISLGIIEDVIVNTESSCVFLVEVEQKITRRIRHQVKDFGFNIIKFTFRERGFVRSYRLINGPGYSEE